MRKLDKKLNIYKANLLAEERYLNEDWKTNLAAGLATAGAVGGAQAQNTKSVDPNQQSKTIQNNPTVKNDTNVANPYGVEDDSMIHPRTIPIVGIQTGITVGPKGIPAVYVYHNHKPGHPNYNPETDREIVYVSNLDDLRKTNEYQEYMRKLNKNRNTSIVSNIDEETSTGEKLNLYIFGGGSFKVVDFDKNIDVIGIQMKTQDSLYFRFQTDISEEEKEKNIFVNFLKNKGIKFTEHNGLGGYDIIISMNQCNVIDSNNKEYYL